MHEKVKTILLERNPKLCVIATATKEGLPEAALVGYAIMDDGTIILSTKKETRKAKNIEENNKIALVFGFSFTEFHVQLEGTVHITTNASHEAFFFSQNTQAEKFKTQNDIKLVITPTWMRWFNPADSSIPTQEARFDSE